MTDKHDPERCTPCRGTGQVLSALGGTQTQVTCPWCDGTGRRRPGRDAQAARREGAANASSP